MARPRDAFRLRRRRVGRIPADGGRQLDGGRAPLDGWRLGLLAGLWLAGRLALGFAGWLPPAVVAIVDGAFLPVLGAVVASRLLASKQKRNIVLLVPLAVLFGTNVAIHLEMLEFTDYGARRALYLAVYVVVLLVLVIGGRVVPNFTANALKQEGRDTEVRDRPQFGVLSIGAVAALILFEVVAPQSVFSAAAALLAAFAVIVRMAGWWTPAILGKPILWVLHLGYGWLAFGLLLKGVTDLVWVLPPDAALHVLTTGAIGTMILGMMTRIALGHTGRPLRVVPAITAAYGALTLAAVLRIAAAVSLSVIPLVAAAALWSFAFLTFVGVYWPILTGPRADGKPG